MWAHLWQSIIQTPTMFTIAQESSTMPQLSTTGWPPTTGKIITVPLLYFYSKPASKCIISWCKMRLMLLLFTVMLAKVELGRSFVVIYCLLGLQIMLRMLSLIMDGKDFLLGKVLRRLPKLDMSFILLRHLREKHSIRSQLSLRRSLSKTCRKSRTRSDFRPNSWTPKTTNWFTKTLMSISFLGTQVIMSTSISKTTTLNSAEISLSSWCTRARPVNPTTKCSADLELTRHLWIWRAQQTRIGTLISKI